MPRARQQRTVLRALFVVAASAAALSPAGAQLPESFVNLQVLPRDIERRELLDTMKGFSRALGVPCQHCHVGEAEQPLTKHDFASDAKPAKQTARMMIRMTREINGEYLAQLAASAQPRLEVRCVTCHHGQPRPQTLGDVLTRVIAERGIDTAVVRYRELRAEHYGGAAYDFRERTLSDLAQERAAAGLPDEAIALLRLNAEYYSRSAPTHFLLGELYRQKGDRPAAIASYRRALSLRPDDATVHERLQELEGRGPETGGGEASP